MKNVLYILITIIIAGIFFLIMTVPWMPSDTIKVYFLKDGGISTVDRKTKKGVSPEETAIKELLKGPTYNERMSGYFTEIPNGTKLKKITKEKNLIKVDFTKELENYGGGTSRVKGLLAQIVYTVTNIKDVEKVQLLIEGKEEVSLGGEGYIIDKPLSREDVQ